MVGTFDPHMLETILINLLENAIKYGGLQQKITIDMEKLDRFVTIKIADEGPGIAANERMHILKSFTESAPKKPESKQVVV